MIGRILQICADEMTVPVAQLNENFSFETSSMDSLEFVQLMNEVEKVFWRIPDELWAKIDTPMDIVRQLEASKP